MERDVLVRLRRLLDDAEPRRRAAVDAMFDREASIPHGDAEADVGSDQMERLVTLGLVRACPDGYAPQARIDRIGGLLVASDLRRRRLRRDFVVGPGPASRLLAAFVRPGAASEALDLGCGSGIQGLWLASTGARTLGVDINPRAVAFTRFNAALNGFCDVRACVGDFLGDAADRSWTGRFDLVVANPPFVLAPSHELTYRDRPLPGDEVGRRTVARVAAAVRVAGRGYVLCNWIGRGSGDWSAPVRGWLAGLGVDAVVIRVGDHSPQTYATMWTRDLAEADRPAARARWTSHLVADAVDGVQIGVIAVGRRRRRLGRPRFNALDRATGHVTREVVEALLAA